MFVVGHYFSCIINQGKVLWPIYDTFNGAQYSFVLIFAFNFETHDENL